MIDWLVGYVQWLFSFVQAAANSVVMDYLNPFVGEEHPEHYYYFSNVELVMVGIFFMAVFILSYYLFQIRERDVVTHYPRGYKHKHKNWIGHILIGPISLLGGYLLAKAVPAIVFVLLFVLSLVAFLFAIIAPLIIASVTAALIFKGLEKRAQPTPETE